MTLTPGPWLGLPAVPAVTLYKHDDPALVSLLSHWQGVGAANPYWIWGQNTEKLKN